MAKKALEPMLWLMFSAGGVLAALFLPIHVLLFGVAFPLGLLDPSTSYYPLYDLLRHPLTRIYLFLLCSLSLFHWAHRFRYTLYDGLQIKHLNGGINTLCYGGAILGSVLAAYLLFVTVPWGG